MTTELREAIGEIRSINEQNKTADVRVVSYNIADSYGSVWEPGVFDESLRSKLPSACWGHERTSIFGSVREYDSTPTHLDATLGFADFGDVPLARMAYSLMKDQHVKDTSFAFARYPGGWRDERNDTSYKPTLPGESERLSRARLDEVSVVLTGAVPGSQVLNVRGTLLDDVRAGRMTVSDALKAFERDLVTAGGSNLDRKGMPPAFLARVPHTHVPATEGDASSKCKTCGSSADAKVHSKRDLTDEELRALAVELNSLPIQPDLRTAQLAISTAIALLNTGVDLRSGQLAGLLMAADSFMSDDDHTEEALIRATELLTEVREAVPDTEVADALAVLTGRRGAAVPPFRAGSVDTNKGGHQLMEYWIHGKGAAKINWGVDGDYNRCLAELTKYVGDRAHGLCNVYHVHATGKAPGHAPGESKPGSGHH